MYRPFDVLHCFYSSFQHETYPELCSPAVCANSFWSFVNSCVNCVM